MMKSKIAPVLAFACAFAVSGAALAQETAAPRPALPAPVLNGIVKPGNIRPLLAPALVGLPGLIGVPKKQVGAQPTKPLALTGLRPLTSSPLLGVRPYIGWTPEPGVRPVPRVTDPVPPVITPTSVGAYDR